MYDLVLCDPPPPTAMADGELMFTNKWLEDLADFR